MWKVKCGVLALFFAICAYNASAAVETSSKVASLPHVLIEQTTDDLIFVINEAKGYFDQDPDRYYGEIERLVEPLIDFNSFARSVMGPHASKKRYSALKTDDERKLFKDRVNRFSDTFKDGLVKTYGKGLLTFGGQKIEVKPPTETDLPKIEAGKSVSVLQLIHSSSEKPYVIKYKMRRNKEARWQVRNVTIETINIGKVYRSQFDSAMRKHKSDLEKVIETWTVPTQSFEKKES